MPDMIPEQAGHGGFTRSRTVEVRFWDSSAHQTCLCKRTRDGVTVQEDPTSIKRLSWSQHTRRSPISSRLSARAREPFKPDTLNYGQLKERLGFLVIV